MYKSSRSGKIFASAAGDLEPTDGEARRSHTLRVGRYAQHFVDALQMDSNPVEYLMNKYPRVRLAECHLGTTTRISSRSSLDNGAGHHHLPLYRAGGPSSQGCAHALVLPSQMSVCRLA